MISKETLKTQLNYTIDDINIPGLGEKIPGKVRDCYVIKGENGSHAKRVLITSDRLSAFDKILTTIPFKGQLLNKMASFWFEQTKDIIENHVISHPHPNVFIAREVEILPIEVVVRGFLAGSAWRDYQAGRDVSGIKLPAGMKKSQRFEMPIITPSTKAPSGTHDEPISSKQIVATGVVEKDVWSQVEHTALALFERGQTIALERGLILVDTKYEFGLIANEDGNKKLVLADEIHTQDSSRYWVAESYQDRFENDIDPEMLDKEFVRRHLMERYNYMGDGPKPVFEDEFRIEIALKYIDACERITGKEFIATTGNPIEEIANSIRPAIK
jgi:phosphoribosylaminoimidazole-succinocarboxamide synthase